MRKLFFLIVTTSLFACAEEPLPDPDYQAPSNGQAMKAFKSALKSDWLDKPFDVSDIPSSTNATNYRKSVEWNKKQLANKKAPKVYGALQKLKVNSCEWSPLKKRDIPKHAQERISSPPAASYRCIFTLHYRINPPYGKLYEMDDVDIFFREDRSFVYAGKFAHPY